MQRSAIFFPALSWGNKTMSGPVSLLISRLETLLETRSSLFKTRNSKLETQSSRLETRNTRLEDFSSKIFEFRVSSFEFWVESFEFRVTVNLPLTGTVCFIRYNVKFVEEILKRNNSNKSYWITVIVFCNSVCYEHLTSWFLWFVDEDLKFHHSNETYKAIPSWDTNIFFAMYLLLCCCCSYIFLFGS